MRRPCGLHRTYPGAIERTERNVRSQHSKPSASDSEQIRASYLIVDSKSSRYRGSMPTRNVAGVATFGNEPTTASCAEASSRQVTTKLLIMAMSSCSRL